MYTSVSCSFPTVSSVCIFFATAKLRIYYFSPRNRTFFCAAVHLSALVGLIFCSVTLLFAFYFYWSISSPSSVFTLFCFLFQSPTKEPGVVYLLVDRFVSNWFWNRWSPSLCGNVLRQRSRDFTQKANGICFLFLNCFFFYSFFTSPSHMCLFYAEAFFHPFHFAKLSSWRFFPGLSFFPLRLYRLVYAFTRAVKRLLFPFSLLLL